MAISYFTIMGASLVFLVGRKCSICGRSDLTSNPPTIGISPNKYTRLTSQELPRGKVLCQYVLVSVANALGFQTTEWL